MQFNGYSYRVNMSRGSTMYYQCSVYRTKKTCKGKLIGKETGEHTCKAEPEPSVQDCDEEMRQLLETEAVKSPGVIPSRLWKKVGDQLAKKYPGQAMKPMKREEVINFINYVRKQANGGDEYRQIETFPTVCVSESDERSFVQFNVFYDNAGKGQRIIGMGHPDVIRLLKYPGASVFIDGTFSITPPGFQQTLIVMVHDPTYDVYIPGLYMLVEAKDEWTNWHALHWVRVLGKMQMTPSSITSDFEAALIKGIRNQFQGTSLIGCLFHWKQAIRRKLIDLRIPANQIAEAMSPGVIDVLTVIPIDEIRSKGIPYVMSIVNTKGAARIWTSFWDYFVRTWMAMFPPSLWNVNTYIEQEMEMQNRTNNPIESYNRRAKKAFGSHPTLVVFVEQAKEEAKRYLELLDDISMHRRVALPHADPVTLSIPPAYTAFRMPKRRKVKK